MKKKENKKEGKKKYIWLLIIIGIICFLAVIKFVLSPIITRALVNRTCNIYGEDWYAVHYTEMDYDCPPGSNCKIYEWSCCKDGKNDCIDVEKNETYFK